MIASSFRKVLPCAILFLLAGQFCSNKTDGQTYLPGINVHCRKFVPGGPGFMNFFVEVPLTVPGGPVGNGVGKHFEVSDPNHDFHHSNCVGVRYAYGTLTMNPTWTVNVPFFGDVTHAHCKSFYDFAYVGYHQPKSLDYSQNCHGFAFGKGDWPDAANVLIGAVPLANSCYVPCYPNEAIVASDVYTHSIKATGTMCPHAYIPILQIPKYVTSAEQYAVSGTYSRANGCPHGLDIGMAHTFEKWSWITGWEPPNLSAYKLAP